MASKAFLCNYLYFVKWPTFSLAIGSLAMSVTYYFLYIGRKPQLITKSGSPLKEFLLQYCPIFDELFWPTIWCFGGRAQTVIGSVLKLHPIVHYRRELVETPDGGELYLDWLDNSSKYSDNPGTYPTVLILPGLTGTSQHGYVLHFVKEIENQGYRTVVMNNRGLAGAKLKTPRAFCAANTDDLEHVITHIRSTNPGIPLLAIGVSLGGIILTNYLAKFSGGRNTGLVAAMTISVPWDLFKSANSLEEPLNRFLFNHHLTNLLCRLVKENMIMVEVLQYKGKFGSRLYHVLQSRTVREFDNRLIAPMFGFKNSDDYYSAATLHSKPLDKINIPLLCLTSEDDPFAPLESLPLDKLNECPNVVMALTSYGGHIGFTEGLFPTGSGYSDRMISQYARAIFENGQALRI